MARRNETHKTEKPLKNQRLCLPPQGDRRRVRGSEDPLYRFRRIMNKSYGKEKLCQNTKCLSGGTMSYFTLSTAEMTDKYCSQRCQEAVEGQNLVSTEKR